MNRDLLSLDPGRIEEINEFLTDTGNPLIEEIMRVIGKYGTVEEINRKGREAKELPVIFDKLERCGSSYLKDLNWLIEQRDKGSFIPVSTYRRNCIGESADSTYFEEGKAVTLEISALQYFPWLIKEAEQAIKNEELMPARYIRVRNMKESEYDNGDLLAIVAAMEIIGASYVETLDTRGTDGSNVHLGGPETITGYFGGVGQPNRHPLKWIDEYLYYYTNYGVSQALNVNPGTVFVAYMLYKLGIDISFKISVFMGNDNPYSVLWTLLMARLFAREDGSTPLVGFNLSNSVDAQTIELSSMVRSKMNLENHVRIEHHITETYQSIVRQPYNRRDELLAVAKNVPNIAAKHEGGDPDVEEQSDFPSSILHYFRTKEDVLESGDMERMERNYLEKHQSVNNTARALTEQGLSFIAARKLHRM